MKKIMSIFAVSLLLFSCNTNTKTKEEAKAITLETLATSAEELKDELVSIEGMVTHVCKHGGQKCFVLDEDGETQIRIVPSGDIDEFKIELEGSTVAFKGVFRVLNPVEAEEHQEDHESKEHHETEMAHSEAEKADYFVEAVAFKEVTE